MSHHKISMVYLEIISGMHKRRRLLPLPRPLYLRRNSKRMRLSQRMKKRHGGNGASEKRKW